MKTASKTRVRIFYILTTSEDSDDVISRFFTVVCANSEKLQVVWIYEFYFLVLETIFYLK